MQKAAERIAKTITDHEDILSKRLLKIANKIKHQDLPKAVNGSKLPRREIEEKRFEVWHHGYNPAWVYSYNEMWKMDLPKANSLINKEPHFFKWSIYTPTRVYNALAFECCRLLCKRQFCKDYYDYENTYPKCAGCDKYFCAV